MQRTNNMPPLADGRIPLSRSVAKSTGVKHGKTPILSGDETRGARSSIPRPTRLQTRATVPQADTSRRRRPDRVLSPRAEPRVLCADPGSMVRLSSTNSVIQSRHLMATVEQISIALTGDLAALVRKEVESGD